MRSLNQPSNNGGFSLAELLVASTMLAVILTAVYTAFSSSVNLWKLGEANTQTYQDARTSLGIFTRELQNMVAGAGHLFTGGPDEFEFFAVTRPMNVEDGSDPCVLKITYRLKSDPDGEGKLLIREERPVESSLPSKPPDEGSIDSTIIELGRESQFEMAQGVKAFKLQYYWVEPQEELDPLSPQAAQPAKFIIRDELEEGEGIPQAIRIELTILDPNAEDGESEFVTYAVIQGPSTRLEEDSLDAEEVTVQ